MDFWSHLYLAFGMALEPMNLLVCFLGVLMGTLTGVLPGLGSQNPLSREERVNKFMDCVKGVLSKREADRCLDIIEHLEEVKNISHLTDILSSRSKRKS